MIKAAAGKLKTYDGVVFCFIASVIIAVVSYNIGLLTEPGKILPTGLSMRNGEMSANILRGIDLAVEDVELITSGKASSDLWRLLTFVHLDLFFYLALLIPKAGRLLFEIRPLLLCHVLLHDRAHQALQTSRCSPRRNVYILITDRTDRPACFSYEHGTLNTHDNVGL